MSGPSWHPLPVAHHDIPTLLVSTAFTPSSYTIHITDMANLWSENLERKAICMRGFKEDTSIDPSEDSEQMGLFLGKIRAAFDQDAPDHNSTSLALAGTSEGDLVLRVTCVLPKPLKPLKWPVYLKKCPGSSIATELVLPLIQAHHTRVQETDTLVSLLKEKDAVIAKLLDKHESMGTGLENIFTALSSKRKVSRAAAEDRIKGLAPFRESEVKARLDRAHNGDSSLDVKGLIQEAFGGKGLRYRSDLDIAASADLDTWWTTLKSGSGVQLVERKKEASPAVEAAPPTPTKPADDDDDFQVQATPPHLMSAKKREAATKRTVPDDEDDGTTDEDAPIPDSNPPPKPSSSAPKKSKLGAIGKKKQATPPPKSPSPAPEEQPAEDVAMGDAASATASEADEAPESSPPPAPKPSSQPKKGGLGRIGGGKAKAADKAKSKSPSPEPPASQGASKPAGQRKLGQIGKKKEPAKSEEPDKGEDSRGRGRTPAGEKPKEEEKPRETSEERADRKRAELQKELQRKAAAGPAKKKRKF